MKIYRKIQDIVGLPETAVALGNFDGVHLGHAKLIRHMVELARQRGLVPAVFTFSNHPQNVLTGRTLVRSLLPLEEKEACIADIGVECLFSLPFDDGFHGMGPRAFIDGLLLGRFHARAVHCGYNFRFGAKAAGHTLTLEHAAADGGFSLDVMEPFEIDDSIVSSSLVRSLVSEGKVDEAARFLGRPYALSGVTVRGNGYGRDLGFPTANIAVDSLMVRPAFGVYVTETLLNGRALRSVTNIGVRPTIGDERLFVESHIMDIPDEDLYGKRMRVSFLKMIRPERKFGSLKELVSQIDADRITAAAYSHE